MRRALHVLLVVMLVLRGLAGSAMAAGMALPAPDHVPAMEMSHAGHAAEHGALPQPEAPDCAAHATPATTAAACAACDICHTALLEGPAAPPAPGLRPAATWPPASARFASALPAPAIKPPIA